MIAQNKNNLISTKMSRKKFLSVTSNSKTCLEPSKRVNFNIVNTKIYNFLMKIVNSFHLDAFEGWKWYLYYFDFINDLNLHDK